ncbi:hypothetical protein Btru_001125 [Bulinus truncatus]|nr:hypothetical protein Btru_001125 [Bulinus truncatus]
MGQNSSKRGSYTPGRDFNDQDASSPVGHGDIRISGSFEALSSPGSASGGADSSVHLRGATLSPSGSAECAPPIGYHVHVKAVISGNLCCDMDVTKSSITLALRSAEAAPPIVPSLTNPFADPDNQKGNSIYLMERLPRWRLPPWLCDVKPAPVKLMFYNKTQKDILWCDELDKLKKLSNQGAETYTPKGAETYPKGCGDLYPKGCGDLYPKGCGDLYPKGFNKEKNNNNTSSITGETKTVCLVPFLFFNYLTFSLFFNFSSNVYNKFIYEIYTLNVKLLVSRVIETNI